MDEILLKNMSFFGHHGTDREEQRIGQRIYVDLSIKIDLSKAAESDNLEDTINYAEVFERVKLIVEGESCKLLERIAGKINKEILDNYKIVESIKTSIHKPGAPINGIFDDVVIVIQKKRDV